MRVTVPAAAASLTLLRAASYASSPPSTLAPTLALVLAQAHRPPSRMYAKAKSLSKSKSRQQQHVEEEVPLVPRSAQVLPNNPVAGRAHAAADEQMQAAVTRFRATCAALEDRASGRVTPRL